MATPGSEPSTPSLACSLRRHLAIFGVTLIYNEPSHPSKLQSGFIDDLNGVTIILQYCKQGQITSLCNL